MEVTITTSNNTLFSKEEIAQIELQKSIDKAKQYLTQTDWYCSRKVDSGKEIPQEVILARAAAREFINANEVV